MGAVNPFRIRHDLDGGAKLAVYTRLSLESMVVFFGLYMVVVVAFVPGEVNSDVGDVTPPAWLTTVDSVASLLLIVTSHGRPRQLKQALAAGVPGFVRKTSTAAEFAAGVRTVHAGRRYLDPDLAAAVIGAGESPLTEREAEVLEAAGRGGSVERIAAEVHLASGTTRNYLSAAMGKTGASTRFEAWRIARERDWL